MTFARLGLAISKKTIKKAVDRNRIKRLIREGFRYNQENLGSFDIVVLVKREIAAIPRQDLFETQRVLWNTLFR